MAIITIYDGKTLAVKAYKGVASYEITTDRDYAGKSSVVLAERVGVQAGDFADVRDGRRLLLTGILAAPQTAAKDANQTKLTVSELPTLFNRDVFVDDASTARQVGVEDFLVEQIRAVFKNGDPVLDLPYLSLAAATHKPAQEYPENEDDNRINLLTYAVQARILHGVDVAAAISGGELRVRAESPARKTVYVDATASDVINYDETYERERAARVTVRLQTSRDDPKTRSYATYYLRNDGAITANAADPTRIDGGAELTTATKADAVEQAALDVFAKYGYQHRITMDVRADSALWDADALRVGTPVRLKTNAGGVINTIVSARTERSGSSVISITCGYARRTLLEILRGDRA